MYRELNDYEILYLIKESDDDYDIIFNKYKPLIYRLSSKYAYTCKRYGLEIEDLIQVGYMALFKAVRGFEDKRNNLFYTYLSRVIENAIINEIRNNSTNKKEALNDSISYDILIPNTNLTYLETLVDSKSDFDTMSFIEQEHRLIVFKNSLSFDIACVFEMKFNGYEDKEIAVLLNRDIKEVKANLKVIKNYAVYM